MEILCFGFIFQPISHISTVTFNALGRSDVVLKLEIIKRSIGILLLLISLRFGIKAVALALATSYFINMILNCNANKRLTGIVISDLIKDILPPISISVAMYIFVKLMSVWLDMTSSYGLLFTQIFTGVCIYLLGSWLFNRNTLKLFIKLLKQIFMKNNISFTKEEYI